MIATKAERMLLSKQTTGELLLPPHSFPIERQATDWQQLPKHVNESVSPESLPTDTCFVALLHI